MVTASQGDIIKLNLDPTVGHEQSGYRPVLVISNTSFSKISNMTIVCPITNTERGSPVHVALEGLITTGYVMCDQVRAIDIRAREYKIIESVDDDTLWNVCDIVFGSIDIEYEPMADELSEMEE